MNPTILKLLAQAMRAGKTVGNKAVDVGRVAKEMAGPTISKVAKNVENAGHYVGTKGMEAYKRNPRAVQAFGGGAIGGALVGAGMNDNQDALNTMFDNFDTSGVMSMSQQNIEKWKNAGVAEESARWLGLIDTVYERQDELNNDENLTRQFSTMLEAMNVNYLDMNLDHHNQRRKKAGFDPIEV